MVLDLSQLPTIKEQALTKVFCHRPSLILYTKLQLLSKLFLILIGELALILERLLFNSRTSIVCL